MRNSSFTEYATYLVNACYASAQLCQGHGVKGQGHMGTTLKILWAGYLMNPFTDFHETFTIGSEP